MTFRTILFRTFGLIILFFLPLNNACTAETMVSIQPPNIEDVTRTSGYILAPTILPKDFEFEKYEVFDDGTDIITIINYKRQRGTDYQQIIIVYPVNLPSPSTDVLSLDNLEIEWLHPDDASIRVAVNGKESYLVYGGWSDDSLRELENPNPDFLATYTPEWNYHIYINLYFDYELPSGEIVKIVIRALTYPFEWITTDELVKIAESMIYTTP
jgi:hypothetical protein